MATFSIQDILRFLPHRYPFLLIDRIIDFSPDHSVKAIKNVTYNEPFFGGHFPNRAVMPGVLILEAMAQATGYMALKSMDRVPDDDSIYYFVGIDKARFRQPVVPGDQLVIEAKLLRFARGVLKVDAVASVDGKIVANAVIMSALRNIET